MNRDATGLIKQQFEKLEDSHEKLKQQTTLAQTAFADFKKRAIEIDEKYQDLKDEQRDFNGYWTLRKVGCVLGGVLYAIGSSLRYSKLQFYQDRIVAREAKLSERSAPKAPLNSSRRPKRWSGL